MNTDKRFSARELAKLATGEPEREEGAPVCSACRSSYTLDSDLEPSSFCNLCAQGAVVQLGAEVIRIYEAIEQMPPVLSAPLVEALSLGPDKARAFMEGVLGLTTRKVLSPTGRGAKKKR